MINKANYKEYTEIFMEENSKINLISKNDEKYLWEKHIVDSLSIEKFFEKYNLSLKDLTLLDIGTGGGFEINVVAVDSIAKKIRCVEYFGKTLNLKNLTSICSRVENLDSKFDIITSRAVSSLKNIIQYALPKLKQHGYFIAYKSRKVDEEIEDAKPVLRKFNAQIIDIIQYELPLDETIVRNLVVIKFKN